MKLTRRKFFAGLAVAPLAIAIAPQLTPPDNGSLILATWDKDKYLGDVIMSHGDMTIRMGMPSADWRKLYKQAGLEYGRR